MKDKISDYLMFIMFPVQVIISFLMSYTPLGYLESILFLIGLNSLVILGYFRLKRRFYNASTYLVFVVLIFTIFPIAHGYLFIQNSDNYICNDEYLSQIKNDLNKEKAKYTDCKVLNLIANNLPNSILNNSIDDSLIGKRIDNKNFYFVVRKRKTGFGRPPRRGYTAKSISFFDSINNCIAKVDIVSESLNAAILKKNSEGNSLEARILNPKSEIRFPDLWIDSITGFVFGNFKPIGRIALLLQMVQIVTFFIFAILTSKIIESISIFRIARKN